MLLKLQFMEGMLLKLQLNLVNFLLKMSHSAIWTKNLILIVIGFLLSQILEIHEEFRKCGNHQRSTICFEEAFNGLRQSREETILRDMSLISYQLMEIYSIKLTLKLVWTTDILKENSKHIQVLKIWSILPSLVIPELAKHLDIVFGDYKMNVINRCKEKLIEGDLVLPKTWPTGVNGRGNTAFTRNGDPSEDLANRLALLHCIT
ncbi:hypothetical protein LIER_27253 [Lithospermum erythrorhizon]|uniref:Uncharacterized protein n=1 Tax=Lithospermum erythrorhizon TaxID=34254 RepID=A0AAV3RFF5_LITER